MSSSLPWEVYTLLPVLYAVFTRPGIFTPLVVLSTPLTAQFNQLWSTSDMDTLLRAGNTPRTWTLVITLITAETIMSPEITKYTEMTCLLVIPATILTG
jgi:hypothetical protein